MKYTLLIEVPEATDVTDPSFDQDVVWELGQMNGEWPSSPMPDTKVIAGKKLIHALIDTNASDPLLLVNALITTYSLDWTVMAMQTFDTTPVYDGNGDLVSNDATTLMIFNTDALDYMNDRLDGDGPALQTPEKNWVSKYQGQSDWV